MSFQTLYGFLLSVEHKQEHFEECWLPKKFRYMSQKNKNKLKISSLMFHRNKVMMTEFSFLVELSIYT